MGWIAIYVLLIPLAGGIAWYVIVSIKARRSRTQQLASIQKRLAEKENSRQ